MNYKIRQDYINLKKKKLFLFDMDGTIYNENVLFDGTLDLLNTIIKNKGHYVFITNNSSKSLKDYIDKINKLGIEADENSFFTSTQASILQIKENFKDVKVYCQGTKSFIKELIDSGISVTEEITKDIGLILIGFDTELTSEKLRKTCQLLTRDIPYWATNCDLRCPVNFGYIPDCGSICGMLKNCTGREPKYIGKPEPTMVQLAMKKFNVTQKETVVIGDRLYTDIASGNNAGVDTICVLTGEASLRSIENSVIKPTYIFESVKEIWKHIKKIDNKSKDF